MKPRIFRMASCLRCLGMLIALLSLFVCADGAEKPSQRKLYDESSSGDKQLADALAIAKREHKHILLQFGANWCGWCVRLHQLFESDKAVHDELSANYVLVLIDANQDHNRDFAVNHGADNKGLPFLVVLDSGGKVLTTKDTSDLEEGDHHSPQKVLAFLKAWGPASFAANPKVTFIGCDGVDGGTKRLYFKAENAGQSEMICRLRVEQRSGSETSMFSIPAGGSNEFSFFVRPDGPPKIKAEVMRLVPVSEFTVPLPNQSVQGTQPFNLEMNRASPASGPRP